MQRTEFFSKLHVIHVLANMSVERRAFNKGYKHSLEIKDIFSGVKKFYDPKVQINPFDAVIAHLILLQAIEHQITDPFLKKSVSNLIDEVDVRNFLSVNFGEHLREINAILQNKTQTPQEKVNGTTSTLADLTGGGAQYPEAFILKLPKPTREEGNAMSKRRNQLRFASLPPVPSP